MTHRQRITTLIAAAALIVLTMGGLTWLLLVGPGDDDPTAETTTQSSAPALTTTTRATEYAEDRSIRRGDGGGDGWRPDEGLPLPPMGIQTSALNWELIELPGPEEGEYWVDQVFEMNGRLYVSGGGWDERSETELGFLFESIDGRTWTEMTLPDEATQFGGPHVAPAGNQLVALVHGWSDHFERPDLAVFVSSDATTWTEVDVSGFAGEGEQIWLWHATGAGDTLLLAGNLEPVFTDGASEEPIFFHKDGLTLEIDHQTRSFLITDDATGEVVLHGSEELMFDYEREDAGAVLYDPETGERVFSMPWEELNRRAQEIYETALFGGDFVLEYEADGRRMTFDQFTRQIVVSDIATGAVLFTGSEDVLWQGQPPTFIDPDTDTVVMRLTWEEWNTAHEERYPDDQDYWSRGVVFASTDGGVTFTEVDLTSAAGEGFSLHMVVGGPNGFLAFGGYEGNWVGEGHVLGDPQQVVVASTDGLSWSKLTTNLGEGWMHTVKATTDGYLAIMGTEVGSTVLRSPDGATWTPALEADDLLLPMGSAWFDQVADGPFGTFVAGSRDGWEPGDHEATPRVYTKQGRTLTIHGPEYTLVDDATGTVLFTFDEQAFWEGQDWSEDMELRSPVRWGEGGFAIFAEDGTLLFALSHDEQWSHDEEEDPEEWYEGEQILLRHDGVAWSSIELPEQIGPYSWFSGLLAGDDQVLIVAQVEDYADDEWPQRLFVFLGTG